MLVFPAVDVNAILNQWVCCTAVGHVCLAVDESAILSQWYPVDLFLAMDESVIHVLSQWCTVDLVSSYG